MRYRGETIRDPWRPLPDNPRVHIRLRRWLGEAAERDDINELLEQLHRAKFPPWPAIPQAPKFATQTPR